jgi:uncharacterized protein YdeI (YjbR/CyaY-like superfamily)
MKAVFFPTPSAFRTWLETSHQNCHELWVAFYKKSSGKPSITYPDALDEALCFGWIDGVRKNLAPDAYTVRFTPRKSKSQWSAINLRRAQQLAAAARMQPAGLKAFQEVKDQPHNSQAQRKDAAFDATAQRVFQSNRKAWDFFQAQPPGYRRIATFWVISAKKEETRQKRLACLIANSERGLRLDPMNPLTRPTIPKRPKK